MKPIVLSIAGLHSFREKQEIDFESLCEGGVFGIFGPTGSGKSSILDAMTLALYGKVERAANQTQGIMNHAEDELSVSFTFELLHSSGTKRYLVERSFKRADDIRLRAGSCRLIEKGEESFVLADKTGEVNQKIQELLGLTIEDFTRAVVLPQGKFAEFLSLKGVDRRQMLQRLFHLERYGDELSKKVKARLQEASQKVKEIEAEQVGLGDASQEAIDMATKEASDLEILLTKRKIELTEIEKKYENQTKLWQWEQEKQHLVKTLQSLQVKEQTMNAIEIQVKRSDQAVKLLPYAEELSHSESRYQSTLEAKVLLEKALSDRRENYKKAEEKYIEANKNRILEEPLLLSKKDKLTSAKELTITKLQVENEVKELTNKLNTLHEKLEIEQKTYLENKSLLDRGQLKQKELKQQLSKISISADTREQYQRAREQRQYIEHVRQQIEELKMSYKDRYKQVEGKQELLRNHTRENEELHSRLVSSFKSVESMYEQICEQERKLEFAKHMTENSIEKLRTEQEQNREKKLAEHLANRLQEGEPCPVCGSTEHPNTHILSGSEDIEMEAQMKNRKDSLAQLHQVIPQVISLKLSLEQLADLLINEGISTTLFSAPLVSSQTESVINMSEIELLITEIKGISQDVLQRKEQVQKELKHKNQLQQQLAEHVQVIKISNEELEQLKNKMDKFQQEEREALGKWANEFPNFQLETFNERLKELVAQDQEAQSLHARIEKSVSFLEDKELAVSSAKDHVTKLEKTQIELQGQYKHKQERCLELIQQIQQITNDGDVDKLLKDVELQLEHLYKQEKEEQEIYQEIGRKIQGIEGELKTHISLLNDLQHQLQKANEKWVEQSKDSEFTTLAELQAVIIPPEQSKGLKEELQNYIDEVKQINHELDKVSKLIGDNQITEEIWKQTSAIFIEMKEELQVLVEQKGSINQTLISLKEKHARYSELEDVRLNISQKVEQLGKLQQVLKGNSFVEFLAEEQLVRVARDASERLGLLTRQRYAIEVDSSGGFIMRDDANGGVRRPVNTLSGGETFLTSLALALALSAQIQLRGEYPLQFFFLDEGFGTLDGDLLDTVITALEKLHSNSLSVGVISHVHELRQRLQKKLIVEAAEPSGIGTRVRLEIL
ncbi:exonuclease SbcC [Bacillus mesophilus]|uniref:Nuclease SbcCD subunit C n=1 Tax=Bacillus mesophilus TaxID=1808955 RepID=A0A6M0Q2X1_9BACI|nr:AAA family ATPase [Bacillus mesophilus]MBM7659818.1 exonuclease SbcC [Bacillus mesophilus]NEY70677.1 AAA family ATPase [Bacillus mesophilus]